MARYFTKKITIEELSDKIHEARRNEDGYRYLTFKVQQDLSKINFDTENISDCGFEAFGRVKDEKFSAKDYVGFHTLANGLSYLGITAGGDWEYPIFFILYSSGSELRGYIPKDGNTWNYVNQSAFGNNENADEIGLKQRSLANLDELEFDFEKIESDILKRILYKSKGEIR